MEAAIEAIKENNKGKVLTCPPYLSNVGERRKVAAHLYVLLAFHGGLPRYFF